MNNPAIYPWQTAYVSAILEFEPKKLAAKIKEAVRAIHERMKDPIQFASHEYQAIQDALRTIGVLCAGTKELQLNYLWMASRTYEFDFTQRMENLLCSRAL